MILALLGACASHDYPDGLGLEGQLEREVIALRQRIRALEGELETCGQGGEPGELYAELVQVFAEGEVGVGRRGPVVVVTLPVDHLFAPESGPGQRAPAGGAPPLRFREECTASLDLLATALNAHPGQGLVVVGHTSDASGDRFAGLDRSTDYALAVTRKLIEDFGVDAARFQVGGQGFNAPLASNDLAAGQRANRRVEVLVSP